MSGKFLDHSVNLITRDDGVKILTSPLSLGPVVQDTNQWLRYWAEKTPDRIFLAEREGDGWRKKTYSEMWSKTRCVAQGLLDRGIKPGQSIVVLSGPSIDHGLLMQAAQMIGAVIVPLAEQYALIPQAHERLIYCAEKVNPAMVYAADADMFAAGLALSVFDRALKVSSKGSMGSSISFEELLSSQPNAKCDAVYADINHDTVAKILFTSGSTSHPKGVPNTQRMLCVNQAQYLATLPILGQRHHTILDWLPWNHTFAGNSNFNMALSNGMTLYLDDGKPISGRFERTLENARQVPITLSFDVPVAHDMMVNAMKGDAELRHQYFKSLDIFFYAGASLPSDIWTAIEEMAMAERGEIPLMMSSWGMTETAPATTIMHELGGKSGNIGVPAPEVEVKLLPISENRFELRCKGPNVFEGYYADKQKTAESFDEEGFLLTGDAVGLINPEDVSRGLFFDGRVAEDFKLITGTWVQASMMRLGLLPRLKGIAQDIVICGEGRKDIGLLIFASTSRGLSGEGVIEDATLLAEIENVLSTFAKENEGSSKRIARALVMGEPPSVGDGEITAKGSLNINAILKRRSSLLERLYDDGDPAVIMPKL